MSKALSKFEAMHRSKDDGLRLGQRFCNMYIKGSWPELFYADEAKASANIEQWLTDSQYTEELPQPLKV
jgi:hypothetical protein